MLVAVVNMGMAFAVPPVVVTADDDGAGAGLENPESLAAPGAGTLLPDGVANMKAEAGSPPRGLCIRGFHRVGHSDQCDSRLLGLVANLHCQPTRFASHEHVWRESVFARRSQLHGVAARSV